MKRLALILTIGLCLQLSLVSAVQSAGEDSVQVKELNFVFLHGAGGTICGLQLLADSIMGQLPAYIRNYERTTRGTRIQFDTLQRCYGDDVDIRTWADNVADSINKHFAHKRNLILIGHSMGGKAALYAVAKDVGGLAGAFVRNSYACDASMSTPFRYTLSSKSIFTGTTLIPYCSTISLVRQAMLSVTIATFRINNSFLALLCYASRA